jgi:hypothetical protein
MMPAKTTEKILRLGLFCQGRLIEEKLVRKNERVRIGHDYDCNELVVPMSKLPRTHTLVSTKAGSYRLHISPSMTGRFATSQGVHSLDALRLGRSADLAAFRSGRVHFPSDDVTVLFQWIRVPKERPRPVLPAVMRGGLLLELMQAKVLAGAMLALTVVQLGFIGYLLSQDWPQSESVELVALQGWIEESQIPIQRMPPPDLPVEEPVEPTLAESDPNPTTLARKPKTKEKPEVRPKKPSAEERASREIDRRLAMAKQVESKTILHAVGHLSSEGGGLVDTLVQGARSTDMDEAFRHSQVAVARAPGVERSGLEATRDSGPTGGIVRIDLERSQGARAASDAKIAIARADEEEVDVDIEYERPPKVVGTGVLGPAEISDVIRRRQSKIKACYERAIKRDRSLEGKVVVTFSIGTRGRVTASTATVDSVGDGVGRCVSGVIGKLKFPKPKGGAVTVNKSFVFEVGE